MVLFHLVFQASHLDSLFMRYFSDITFALVAGYCFCTTHSFVRLRQRGEKTLEAVAAILQNEVEEKYIYIYITEARRVVVHLKVFSTLLHFFFQKIL